jgi:AbrB family looped-hinge helix DNA binding protein
MLIGGSICSDASSAAEACRAIGRECNPACVNSPILARRFRARAVDESLLRPYIHIVASRVGERGQITIEKSIREQLGIYAGDEAVQRVEDGRIVIEVVPGRHRRSLAGSLKAKVGRRPEDESWEALRRAAWETADPDRRP